MKSILSMLKSALNGSEDSADASKTATSKGSRASADEKPKDQKTEDNLEDINASDVSADSASISGTAATIAALTGFLGDTAKAEGQDVNLGAGSQMSPAGGTPAVTGEADTRIFNEDGSQAQPQAAAQSETTSVPEFAGGTPAGGGVSSQSDLFEDEGRVDTFDTSPSPGSIQTSASADQPGVDIPEMPSVIATAPEEAASPVTQNAPEMAIGGADGNVVENAADGTVVATLTVEGANGDTTTFTITDSAGNPISDSNFEIIGNQIHVKAGADVNYEDATSHDVYVRASSGTEITDPQQVTVTVGDVAENLVLGDGGQVFTDAGVAETSITGGAGDDTITAHNERGTIDGGAGDDTLEGRDGDDTLSGDVGDDTINGGLGNDVLTGDGPQNFVVNGSFEDVSVGTAGGFRNFLATSVEGWTNARGELIELHESGYLGVDATDGNYWLDTTENNGNNADISQTIEGLQANETYQLSFDAAQQISALPGSTDVYFGGQLIATISPTTEDVFEAFQFEIIGGSGDGSNILRFDADSTLSNIGLALDNVKILTQGDDVLDGGAGDDVIVGGAGDDVLLGGEGNDVLRGDEDDDHIDGGAGIDRAEFGGDISDYTVTYNAGTETFTVKDENTTDGNDGTDTLINVQNFTFNGVTYTATDLQTEANRQANTAPTEIAIASGGTINETVADGGTIAAAYDPSGATVATLTTTDADANDSHSYSIVYDASGKFEIVGDQIRVKSGQIIDYETDTSFNLTIRTRDIHGQTHDEVLTVDVIDFEGNYTAGDGGETIVGTSEEDTIIGGNGSDTINGGAGDDIIFDGSGPDSIDGGEGSDTIHLQDADGGNSNIITDTGTTGTDTLLLDQGDDTYRVQGDFSAATSGIEVIDGSGETGEVLGTQDASANFDFTGITLNGVDRIEGTEAADTIIGSNGDDRIYGLGGDDVLQGGQGNDLLKGGDGNDSFLIGAMQGDDIVSGGGGWTDAIELQGVSGSVSVSGDTITGTGWTLVLDSGHGVENVLSDSINLSSDSAGIITFDAGGTIDFNGVEHVSW